MQEKTTVDGDVSLETALPPPMHSGVKFAAYSILAKNGHLWQSVCNGSEEYLSFDWPIAGIGSPTSSPLDPLDGELSCACERRTVDGASVHVGHEYPLYYVNLNNKKLTSAHKIDRLAANSDGKYYELNTAVALFGKDTHEYSPLFEISSNYTKETKNIYSYIYFNSRVSGFLFGIRGGEDNRDFSNAISSLSKSDINGASVVPTDLSVFKGLQNVKMDVEAVLNISVENAGGKIIFSTQSSSPEISTDFPIFVYDHEKKIIMTINVDLYISGSE